MRRKNNLKTTVNHIIMLLGIILFLNIFLFSTTTADVGERLQLNAPDEVIEGEYFLVSALDPEDFVNDSPYLVNVNIAFNGEPYTITEDDENREITILAPLVSGNTDYDIIATKTGYISDEKTIIVINKRLVVTPQDFIIDADKSFYVTVTDQSGVVITDASVYISSFGELARPREAGVYLLTSPQDQEEIKIIAQKEGYDSVSVIIDVNLKPNWINEIIQNPYFPIALAIIILIIAVLAVHFKQKRLIYTRAKEISHEKTLEKYDTSPSSGVTSREPSYADQPREIIRVQNNDDAKVEEIRISRPQKEKEVVEVKTEEDETEKVISRKKLLERDYDWFEGTDETRYEIDKLTGEVDEDGIDKWFEGVDGLKEKISEKVKKKDKKTEEEEEKE